MNGKKRSSKAVAPVIATILVIIIAITLSLVLSTFSSGLFQTLSAQESFDAKVVKVKKTGTAAWDVGVFITNTGQRDVTLDSVKVRTVAADVFSGACTTSTCTLKPGQSVLATSSLTAGVTGDTVDVEVLSKTGSLIFTSIRLP